MSIDIYIKIKKIKLASNIYEIHTDVGGRCEVLSFNQVPFIFN